MIKKLTFITTLLFTATFLSTQTGPTKRQELGVTFSNFDSFGFTYRVGKENNLWRFSTGFISGGTNTTEGVTEELKRTSFGLGVQIGKELRKPISEKFTLRYGLDLSFRFNHNTDAPIDASNNEGTKYNAYVPGINFVLGTNFQVAERLILGAELLPGASYSYSKSSITAADGTEQVVEQKIFNYGFNNNSAILSLVYQF